MNSATPLDRECRQTVRRRKKAEKEKTDLLESKAVEVKNLMQALAKKEELTREETEKAMKGI